MSRSSLYPSLKLPLYLFALILVVSFFFALPLTIAAASESGEYPMFQYDPQRTGNASGAGPETATLLWQSSEKTGGCIQAGPIVANDRVYVVTWLSWTGGNAINALYCLDRETGSELWNNTGVYGASTAAFATNKLFLGTTAGTLACVNATNGEVLWNAQIDPSASLHGVASSPLVYGKMVYILSFSDGTLHAFSFDGTEQWSFSTGGQIFQFASPAAYADKLLFAGNAGNQHALYCVNLSTHEESWNFTTATEIRATPTIWADEAMIFFTTKYVYGKAHGLYALNLSTGEESWNVTHKSSWASPALSDGRLYIGGSAVDSTFYCYNARNGSLLWKNEEMNGSIDSSPVVAGGKVYFGTNEVDGTVFALDANDGTTLWSYTLQIPPGYGGGYNIASHPAVADRTLFIGVDNIGVLAFRDPQFMEFETGMPEHPYPSIPGTFYGSLTPAHDLLVNAILTRACDGTGGHAEYVRIWNDTWNGATAQWNGYEGDWRTITFPEPFLLHENETYQCRIDTGSYAQLHHKNALTVSDGVITCTNFTDANGVIHTGVIPAIRLYYH
jgi:outer membrane protein assembly factor BamB